MPTDYGMCNCENCDQGYKPRRPDQRFCSPKCRNDWWNKSNPVVRAKSQKEKK